MSLKDIYQSFRSPDPSFWTPEPSELTFFYQLFNKAFSRLDKKGFADLCLPTGMTVVRDGDFLIIHEEDMCRKGQGLYVVNLSKEASPVLLQAPHSFFDKLTGDVALKLFMTGKFKALAINTTHRYGLATDVEGKVPCDLAHMPTSPFTMFTEAFLNNQPVGKVMQVHGFSMANRGGTIDDREIIISPGHRWWNDDIERIQLRLKGLFQSDCHIFPLHFGELGGVRNCLGCTVRSHGRDDFVHLSLSEKVRLELVTKELYLRRFATVLCDAWTDSYKADAP